MKTLDLIVAILVVLGGLNWGVVGFFNYDVVAAIFGEASVVSRVIYSLFGLCALYEAVMVRWASKRWGIAAFKTAA
jgi:uncharacterized membrane protein YuzA (DUF378 family)